MQESPSSSGAEPIEKPIPLALGKYIVLGEKMGLVGEIILD